MNPALAATITQLIPVLVQLVILVVIPAVAYLAKRGLDLCHDWLVLHVHERDRVIIGDAVKLAVHAAEEAGLTSQACLSGHAKFELAVSIAAIYLHRYGVSTNETELTAYINAAVNQQFHGWLDDAVATVTAPAPESVPAPVASVSPSYGLPAGSVLLSAVAAPGA